MQPGEVIAAGGRRVTARAVVEADSDLLLRIYGSTREVELSGVPWSAEQKRHFVAQQFAAQSQAYRTNYPGAAFMVLMVDGADAGRLYLHRGPQEIRIMDIALLPAFRSLGIGSAVLRHLQGEASSAGLRLSIHVEVFNPAWRLYERLGFRPVGRTEVYALLEWSPAP